MSTEEAGERLTLLARRAREGAARLAAQRTQQGGPPAPGDLFVLAVTGELPVEWAILDRRPGSGELLAVPADNQPSVGSADVEVPAGAPGGPLSLRCRFSAWLDAGLFAAATRSGVLAPETVSEALQRLRELAAGSLEPSPLAEEVDADPEYEDWIRDVPRQARELALAARRQPGPRFLEGYRLAAMFALLAIGLSVWVAQLHREVERLSKPIFDLPSLEVVLGEKTRGNRTVLEVPREASHVLLDLVLDPALPNQVAHFEIADASGRVVWHSALVHWLPGSEVHLVLSRTLLADGEYRARIVPSSGGSPLAERILEIVSHE